MVKVTAHAKERANERLDITHKPERTKLFSKALRYGHPIDQFAGDFKNYLISKKRNSYIGVKVYDNNIYIYKNKTVITVFPVPDKYIPIKDNYAKYIKSNPLLMKLYEYTDGSDVCIEVVQRDNQSTICALVIDDVFKNYGIGQTQIKAENDAITKFFKLNNIDIEESDK